ncbi:hypothetical protein [Halorubrum depositum]|uniref:hypothetical protein n=1 Tax=Halorubrum depositum TaxID=2583992 RepID=UPI0011A3523E|nr:hypothetical protein [Halorubrum depositum]
MERADLSLDATSLVRIGGVVIAVTAFVVLVLLPGEFLLDPGPLTGSPAAVAGVVSGFVLSILGPSLLARIRGSE